MRDSEVRGNMLDFVLSNTTGHPKDIKSIKHLVNELEIIMQDNRKFKVIIEEVYDEEQELNFNY